MKELENTFGNGKYDGNSTYGYYSNNISACFPTLSLRSTAGCQRLRPVGL